MKLTLLDKITWVCLVFVWAVGVVSSDVVLVVFGSLGLLQYSFYAKTIDAIKGLSK